MGMRRRMKLQRQWTRRRITLRVANALKQRCRLVARLRRLEDYEHCKTIFIIIDYISVRGEVCEVNAITYAWDAITIIVPSCMRVYVRVCAFVCALARRGERERPLRNATWMHIRAFPEIVYRFAGFPIGKQSHPNANERVTFIPPRFVVPARSFHTCEDPRREERRSRQSRKRSMRFLFSVTRSSTFFRTPRVVADTIKAAIGERMCESGRVVLISLARNAGAKLAREDFRGKCRAASCSREKDTTNALPAWVICFALLRKDRCFSLSLSLYFGTENSGKNNPELLLSKPGCEISQHSTCRDAQRERYIVLPRGETS